MAAAFTAAEVIAFSSFFGALTHKGRNHSLRFCLKMEAQSLSYIGIVLSRYIIVNIQKPREVKIDTLYGCMDIIQVSRVPGWAR